MMKKIFLIVAICSLQQVFSQEKTIVKGIYNGKNLYIQNPFKEESGGGFCITRVLLNGKVTKSATNASAFELNFSSESIKLGDSLSIVFEHFRGCTPEILNPMVIVGDSTNISEKLEKKAHKNNLIKNTKKSRKQIYDEYIKFIGFNSQSIKSFNDDLSFLKNELLLGRINLLDHDSLYTGLWLINNYMDRSLEKSSKEWLNNMKYEFALLNNFEVEIEKIPSLFKGKTIKVIYKNVDLENTKIIETHRYILKNYKPINQTTIINQIKEINTITDTLYQAGYYWKGLKVGKWVNYSVDRLKTSNIEYDFGKPSGFYQVYHSNGQISEIGYWEKGKNVGEFNTFYEDGNKSQQFTFSINGKREGVAKYFYNNGIISSYCYFKNSIQTGFTLDFDSLGNLTQTKFCSYGDCVDTLLHDFAPIEMMLIAVKTENQGVFNKQEVISLNTRMTLEQEQKKRYLLGIGIIFLISLLLVGLLIRIRKSKKQISKQIILIENQKLEVEQQKAVVEKAHFLLEEKNSEIIASIRYAKRIQDALMTSQKYIERNINRLKN